MSKCKFICLAGLLSLIFLVACQQRVTSKVDEKIFIGDNTKVSQLASKLPYPQGLSYDSIAIQSNEEPYELQVFLRVEDDSQDLQACADQMFEKVSNMGKIGFYDKESGLLLQIFDRD